ncbi:MAG: AAA family ATPase, partial [Armatimonadetes bacterium]|nr:AAA family ATPase [Armatimonadota bacterium]
RRLGRLENDRLTAAQDLESCKTEAVRVAQELEQLRADRELTEARLEEVRSTAAELDTAVRDVRHSRDVAVAARDAIEQQLQAFAQARDEALAWRDALEERLATVDAEVRGLASELEAARAEVQARQAAAEEAAHALGMAQAARQDRDRLLASISARISRAEQEAEGLLAMEAELCERIGRLEAEIEATRARQADLAARRQEAEAQRARLASALADAEEALATCRDKTRRSEQVLTEHRAKLQFLRERIAALEASLSTLQDIAKSQAGGAQALARVMTLAAEGSLRGILGPLAELLDVPENLQVAVATALGEKAQWLVVRDDEAAEAVASVVRSEPLGRLGMFVLSWLPADCSPAESVLSGEPGILGRAASMVRARDDLGAIVEAALGTTVIVDDFAVARRLAAQLPPGWAVVTTAGEMVTASGGLVVGRGGGQTAALAQVGRWAQLQRQLRLARAAEERLAAVEQCLADEVIAVQGSQENAAAAREAALQALRRAEGEAQHLAERMQAAQVAMQDLETDLSVLRSRLENLISQRVLVEETAAGLRTELEALRASGEPVDVDHWESAASDARSALTVAQIHLAQLEQRCQALAEERERVAHELEAAVSRAQAADERARALEARLTEALQTLASLPGVEPLEQRAAAAAAQLRCERDQVEALRRRQADLESRLDILRRRAEEASEAQHRAELALAREEAQLAAVAERLMDQFGLTPDAAAKFLDDSFSRQKAEAEAEQLKEQMRALGPVNLGAVEELARLQARLDYLQAQLDDVLRAREELLQLIKDLDDAAQDAFLRTFEEVQEAFGEIFRRLFDGGETRLELTNPEQPLLGGVDIIVRPPGKRAQNMMLLSGGEKALTAVAFLYALLKVRPSPFCVLDEIDAALDAASTERFISLLHDFSERTQFIIVTHNPQTIAAADLLYGVTMQTPGVSMVLAVELEEAQELAREGRRTQFRVVPAT